MKFPKDAPKGKVVKTFETLGFKIVRIGSHISIETFLDIFRIID